MAKVGGSSYPETKFEKGHPKYIIGFILALFFHV